MDYFQPEVRETIAKGYMSIVTFVGICVVIGTLPFIDVPDSLSIFFLLILFLIITEFFAIPVWKGVTTLGFPILFTIDLLFGLPLTLATYGAAVLVVNILQRRPLRATLFNPSQLVLSFLFAKGILFLSTELFWTETVSLTGNITQAALLTLSFYAINHLLVDIVLWIRPQSFTISEWKKKLAVESIGLVFSIVYLALFYLLGTQNRGVVDIFSFFFFFSPLVGLSLIGASNFKLRREKNRLKGLIAINEDLNHGIPEQDWLKGMESHLPKLFNYDALSVWVNETSGWECQLALGASTLKLEPWVLEKFVDDTPELHTISPLSKAAPYYCEGFQRGMKAAIICPLKVDDEVNGLIIIGRRRPQQTSQEESKMIKALGNQLEVLIKGRNLISEREKRMLLEERNRIAREIHDGIAQSVAGAVMKLEIAQRQSQKNPEQAKDIIDTVLPELRSSVKEIRESIFALRPYPTEERGLHQAIEEEVLRLHQREEVKVAFTKRGEHRPLSPETEKVIYHTFKESLQNALKHANASRINVSICYRKDQVTLKIEDDGQGFLLKEALLKSQKGKHFGIITMNEEAKYLDANLQIDSVLKKGTRIKLIAASSSREGS